MINNSCFSLASHHFWNTFQNLGAQAYYGYSGAVTNDYITFETGYLLGKILYGQQSIEESFEYSYDSQYNGAFLTVCGAGNLMVTEELMNGSFEDNLLGWEIEGDGRCISRLGSIFPIEGSKMAMISTGIGYTMSLGELKQRIYVPKDAATLQFDWNFLSEEFLEYIGTKYNDPFEVRLTLIDENDMEALLLDLDVNKIAADTNYTTAILLDNIIFDVGNLKSDAVVPVSTSLSGAAIQDYYDIYGNVRGKSYVLYEPKNWKHQAPAEQKRIKYMYGYKAIGQVEMHKIETKAEFRAAWNNMKPAYKCERIDTVSLIFHGKYYAIMIDAANGENLTTVPSGEVGSDDSATYIRKLKKQKIKDINILTCCGGLLDAINLDADMKFNGKTLKVKGNVAQAFLDSQDVYFVRAWDAPLAYTSFSYNTKISNKKDAYYGYLKQLKDVRVIVPIRGTIEYNTVTKKRKTKGEKEPKGQIIYQKDLSGKMFCKYTYNYIVRTKRERIKSKKSKIVTLKKFN